MFCGSVILCLLNSITENIQVTGDNKYFPRGPHVGQPCYTTRTVNCVDCWVLANISDLLLPLPEDKTDIPHVTDTPKSLGSSAMQQAAVYMCKRSPRWSEPHHLRKSTGWTLASTLAYGMQCILIADQINLKKKEVSVEITFNSQHKICTVA